MHSILILDVGPSRMETPRVLACEIGCYDQACALTAKLACSYDVHGSLPGTNVFWFVDGAGMHAIWPG